MSLQQEAALETFVEVRLNHPDDFLKVKETLERVGIPSRNSLYQSCHIFHKQQRYFITHFKEMFLLDGKPSSLTELDIARRNTIIGLLEQWGLITVCRPRQIASPRVKIQTLKIVPYRDRHKWSFKSKYTVGKKR